MSVFFINSHDIQDDSIVIRDPLFTHIHKSLRIHQGETLWLNDDRRQRYRAEITEIRGQTLRATLLETVPCPCPEGPRLILGQAILKGDRMNWVIQKATELGTGIIIPLITSRVVVRPSADRFASYQHRWSRIALEAAQQSERWDLPLVTLPCPFPNFLSQYKDCDYRTVLVEREAREGLLRIPLPSIDNNSVVIAIGPEGGWTTEELEEFQKYQFIPVSLGSRILRGETATLASLSIIQSRLGNLG